MFQFTPEELEDWRSQFVMSNSSVKMGLRRPPYAFTEQGFAMFSSVLRSQRAVSERVEVEDPVNLRRDMKSRRPYDLSGASWPNPCVTNRPAISVPLRSDR